MFLFSSEDVRQQPPPRLTAWHPFAQYGIILFCFASVVYEGISGSIFITQQSTTQMKTNCSFNPELRRRPERSPQQRGRYLAASATAFQQPIIAHIQDSSSSQPPSSSDMETMTYLLLILIELHHSPPSSTRCNEQKMTSHRITFPIELTFYALGLDRPISIHVFIILI